MFLASGAQLALAQELPDRSELSQRLSAALPSYWQVDNLKVVAAVREGDIRTPSAVVRFEAETNNIVELFKDSSQRVGPFIVVVPTVVQSSNRTLYGIMELNYSAGAWYGTVEIENPVTGLGQPMDLFDDPVVVLGSDRQQQVTELLASSQIIALTNEFQDEIASIRIQREKELADLEAVYRQDRLEIEQRQAQEIDDLSSENLPELQQLRTQADARSQELEQTFQKELSDLMETNAQKLAEMRAQQSAQIRELEVGFTARVDSLKSQISNSKELTGLQEQFMQVLELQSANYSRIIELHANAVLERAKTMQSYLGQWTGAVTCSNRQQQIRFVAEKVEGQSVSGTIFYPGETLSTYPAVLNILNVDLSRPTAVTLIPTGLDDLWTYVAEIGSDGVLRGQIINQNLCNIVLSQ